jgi:hypothetical protein
LVEVAVLQLSEVETQNQVVAVEEPQQLQLVHQELLDRVSLEVMEHLPTATTVALVVEVELVLLVETVAIHSRQPV